MAAAAYQVYLHGMVRGHNLVLSVLFDLTCSPSFSEGELRYEYPEAYWPPPGPNCRDISTLPTPFFYVLPFPVSFFNCVFWLSWFTFSFFFLSRMQERDWGVVVQPQRSLRSG